MASSGFQQDFWNGPGSSKVFTHPVRWEWLAGLSAAAKILDYGCGYGRLVAELVARGYRDVVGVDPSPALIARGETQHPGHRLIVMTDPPTVPAGISAVDLTLVFAVLTCMPADSDQTALMDEVWRVTAPGGLIYISDLLVGPDTTRYRELADSGFPYGTFRTQGGGLLRHHTADHLRGLVGGIPVHQEGMPVRTMNGGIAHALQILVRKPC